MKKITSALLIALFVMGMSMKGGMPAAHGVDGKTFGSLVSMFAQSYPGAVADHVSN